MADCFDNISFSDDETLPNFSLFPELDSDVSSDKQENIQEKAEHEQDDSSQEIDDFILAERATNTVKKTINDFKKFENFCKTRQPNFNIKTIPSKEFDKLLSLFFRDIRKLDGTE